MQIGFITGEYPPHQGGVGAYTHILARTMVDLGHRVSIFSDQHAQQQDERILLTQHRGEWNFGAIRATQKWARAQELDVISLQFQTAAYSMSPWIHFLPHFLNIPLITTFHDLRFPYLFPKAGFLRTWIVQHLARASSGAIVTNQEDLEHLKGYSSVRLIPIGSNITVELPEQYSTTKYRKKFGVTDQDFLIAHFGFMNHSKGIEVLLHAFAHLDSSYKLLMIGGRTGTADPENKTYADSIDRLIIELEIDSRVHWTGFVDEHEVAAYLQASDIVVLPYRDGASYRRGSLMAAIEHGCAIITTQPTHRTPAFMNEDNMLLIPCDDPSALIEGIHKIRENPDLHKQLRIGTKKLRAEFNWEQIAHNTIEFYKQIYEGRI